MADQHINFTKYHGTGNDFIMIDDRDHKFDISNTQLVADMCSRRFGIGADGLILLRNREGYDFEMVYFNSDGNQSSMCGNGGRCLVHFAHSLGIFDTDCKFLAVDGDHDAKMLASGLVKLKMGDVSLISKDGDDFVLDTGSPHYVKLVQDAFDVDVSKEGAKIRYSDTFKSEGINVNFISQQSDSLLVTTYERGVEDETYSCGTGVTACAIIAHASLQKTSPIAIKTKGGDLSVYFTKNHSGYQDVWLKGPAVSVYTGSYLIGQ